jgi:uncharacterized protein YeeX (DUF496 family)
LATLIGEKFENFGKFKGKCKQQQNCQNFDIKILKKRKRIPLMNNFLKIIQIIIISNSFEN